MGVTFFNISIEIREDDPVKAYQMLDELMENPSVGEWESDTWQLGDGPIGDTLELFRGQEINK